MLSTPSPAASATGTLLHLAPGAEPVHDAGTPSIAISGNAVGSPTAHPAVVKERGAQLPASFRMTYDYLPETDFALLAPRDPLGDLSHCSR